MRKQRACLTTKHTTTRSTNTSQQQPEERAAHLKLAMLMVSRIFWTWGRSHTHITLPHRSCAHEGGGDVQVAVLLLRGSSSGCWC